MKQPKALEYAYFLLKFRSLSEAAMKERLLWKGFAENEVEETLAALRNQKLLNDSQLAEHLAESRLKNRLMGDARVQQELMQKGIDKNIAEKTVRDMAQSSEVPDEEERAYRLILKRRKQIKEIDSRTLFRRLYEHLARRGFSPDTIEHALSRYRRGTHESDKIKQS